MKMLKKFRRWTLGLAVVGLLAPQVAGATQPATQSQPTAVRAQKVADVALHQGGVFVGQVVNRQGAPKAGAKVVMSRQSKVVAVAQTDKQGRFIVRGVRAGVYQVQADQTAAVYRLWAERTAPPAANQAALLVTDSGVALGQDDDDGIGAGAVIAVGAGAGVAVWALDYNASGS